MVILVHGAASEALGESTDLPAPLHTSYPQVPHDCSVKLTGGNRDCWLRCLQGEYKHVHLVPVLSTFPTNCYAVLAGGEGATARSWEQYHAGEAIREPRVVTLALADPHVFLDHHGAGLGAHARNIRHLAAPVSPSTPCCEPTPRDRCTIGDSC